jgi:hypothetical protein
MLHDTTPQRINPPQLASTCLTTIRHIPIDQHPVNRYIAHSTTGYRDMTNDIGVQAIYIGRREDIIAECSSMDPCSIGVSPRDAKWLVQPIGVHDYDVDWCASHKHALATAKALADQLGVEIRPI